jgi:hypothetical protein
MTMRRTLLVFVGLLLPLTTLAGCQSSVPVLGSQTVRRVFGVSAVPGQTEPDLDEFDDM